MTFRLIQVRHITINYEWYSVIRFIRTNQSRCKNQAYNTHAWYKHLNNNMHSIYLDWYIFLNMGMEAVINQHMKRRDDILIKLCVSCFFPFIYWMCKLSGVHIAYFDLIRDQLVKWYPTAAASAPKTCTQATAIVLYSEHIWSTTSVPGNVFGQPHQYPEIYSGNCTSTWNCIWATLPPNCIRASRISIPNCIQATAPVP